MRSTLPPRPTRFAFATVFVVATLALHPAQAASTDSAADPVTLTPIALHWLADWDARNWSACFAAFSPEVKNNIMLDKWELAEGYFEDHLGALRSRKFTQVEDTAIPGEVVIVEFESSFEHVGTRSEGIYLQKDSHGSWSVYALVVKPVSAPWPRQYEDDASAAASPLEIHTTPGLRRGQAD